MAYIESINLRPIKAARMLPVKKCIIQPNGIYGDSQYLLTTHENKIITQRDQLGRRLLKAIIKPHISDHHFKIILSCGEEFTFPLEPQFLNVFTEKEIEIFGDQLIISKYSDIMNYTFTKFFDSNKRIELCIKNPFFEREISRQRYYDAGQTDSTFQDGYNISVVTTSSLNLLKSRHGQDFDINRLRINLVINDDREHIEDNSQTLSCRGKTLNFIESISRCFVINVDQINGEILTDNLLHTLASYRHLPKKHNIYKRGLMMGAGYTSTHPFDFEIQVGDEVYFN